MKGILLMVVVTAVLVVISKVRMRSQDLRRAHVFDDPVLGSLRFDQEVGAWRGAVQTAAGRIGLLIGGDGAPDERLRSHAVAIVSSAAEFVSRIRSYLEAQAEREQRWSAEIRSLALEDVCLFWPSRPNDGMLYFAGPDTGGRVWRCDYINREPQPLGFDS